MRENAPAEARTNPGSTGESPGLPPESDPSITPAIAGCGAITAVGCGLDALRTALRANTSGLRHCERFDHPRFQSSIVGAAPENGVGADHDNPAHRLAAEALREAAEQARGTLASIQPERIGLVLSTTKANIEALERVAESRPCSDAARRHLRADLLAADLAAEHGAFGPVQCVSLACASGLLALQQGARLIQRGEADAMFVVGVDHLSAFVVAGFSALKAVDPAGCRPFDRDRCGLSPGEAGAAIVLVRPDLAPNVFSGVRPSSGAETREEGEAFGWSSPLEGAALAAAEDGRTPINRHRPTIVILGSGSSNDANHMTGPARDGSGLARAIRAALKSAGLRPADVDYVSGHGTGTLYNDAMESQALRSVFGDACPPFSGLKGMLGHTLGAAGVIETILCVLAMEARLMPGTPRLKTAAEDMPASLVPVPRPAARLDRVLKLNSGFGGLNTALLLGRA